MCGFAGFLNLGARAPAPVAALERMAASLRHRGPDAFGLYRDLSCGLAHARLSIIDLAGGHQPLADHTERYWIAWNGEIFNYVELRAELERAGHRFRTRSDTEVIVEAWKAWGQGAFPRLNGQFALALWDSAEGVLVLARDRLGVRPLYIAEEGGRLWFASEVKALFAGEPALPRALDPLGMEQTFTFWTVVPPQSVFQGIKELEPAHLLVFERGKRSEQAFWRPAYPEERSGEFAGTVEDAVAATHAALLEATRLRMLRADVPVGSYLSGGLDSSLIAALGLRAKGEGFHTFSLRFADPEYDETPFQREMAARLGTTHHEVEVTRGDIASVFPQVIAHTERPILRTAPAPLFLLSRLVREQGIKVVLTGEGADEFFAGYDLFREAKVRRFWARAPRSTMRPLLLDRLYPYLARSPVSQRAMARQFFGRNLDGWREPGFAHDTRWQGTAALKRLFSPRLRDALAGRDVVRELLRDLPPEFPRWSFLARDQYLEVRTLLSGYLLSSQGDRMLMGHSVEGRFPFLDPNVVALADSLPPAYKLRVLDEKHVLKRVARGLIPDTILARKKQPYRAPDALSFTGTEAPAWVEECLDPRAVDRAGIFDPDAVRKLWSKCRERAGDSQFSNADNMAVVGVLSTQLLHRQFVDEAPAPGVIQEFKVRVDRVAARA